MGIDSLMYIFANKIFYIIYKEKGEEMGKRKSINPQPIIKACMTSIIAMIPKAWHI